MAFKRSEIAKEAWINNVLVPPHLEGAWDALVEMRTKAREAKEAFERDFTAYMRDNGLPANRDLAFNYNFGKLSVAEKARVAPTLKPVHGQKTLDLAAFYAQQAANGRRA